ncbi:hypothetical protein JW905_06990 [bacterium]|nr:hypothetical protein [candidate division CSSED10-310 bacterium]
MLNQDFKKFIELLNNHDVNYLVVGGYAMGFHGCPRYTKDLEIWLEASADNAKRALIAMERFGFASFDLAIDAFIQPDMVIQLGYAPVRIDLLISMAGVTFSECYPKRIIEVIGGMAVNFIGRDSLVIAKRAAGRFRGLADAENLSQP